MFSSGAMFVSQPSQIEPFGATQGMTEVEGTPTKKPRSETKETCLPVTIRAIEVALANRSDKGTDLQFYGCAEPQMVIVVAMVESVQRQAASLEVALNDATGRIKGRYFVVDPQPGDLDRIAPGCYVSAFGEVRAAPVQHLAVKGLRIVEGADEVGYHVIEAAHAALRLQKSAAGPTTPAPKKEGQVHSDSGITQLTPQKPGQQASEDIHTPAASPAPEAPMPVAAAPAAVPPAQAQSVQAPPSAAPRGAELRAAVLGLLRDDSLGPEGLHASAIAEKLSVSVDDVKPTMAELVDDGEVFVTITEEHFAAV